MSKALFTSVVPFFVYLSSVNVTPSLESSNKVAFPEEDEGIDGASLTPLLA